MTKTKTKDVRVLIETCNGAVCTVYISGIPASLSAQVSLVNWDDTTHPEGYEQCVRNMKAKMRRVY